MSTPDTLAGRPEAPATKRRRWAWPVVAIGALILGIAIGGGGGGAAPDPTTTDAYQAVAAERDDALSAADTADARADAEGGATLATRERELDDRAATLDSRESDLTTREAVVTATEQQVAANQIQIGTWTVGIDIEPGTYRTLDPVTEMCYWGIYTSGTNKADIIDNDLVQGGNPTVTLGDGQDFENGCGVWGKQ